VTAAAADRGRFRALALIATGTMINYLDRTVLGIAAPMLTVELDIAPAVMGVVFSAFSWSYAAAQIPGGVFLDRFGNRLTYMLAVAFWSLFTLLQGFARGAVSLVVFRLGLGVSEAPCFPVNSRVVTTWFPERERARATAVYTVGEYLGLACFGPLLFWIAGRFGWRALFFVVGAAGLVFAMLWHGLYREPAKALSDSAAGEPIGVARTSFSRARVRALLRHRQIWGACLGQFGGNSTLVFFLTWFPTYLATERQLDWTRAGFFAVLPFLAAAAGVMSGGWASDALLKGTGSRNWARKLPIIVGLGGASTIMLANYAESDWLVIAVMSFAFFCQGMTGLGWTVISDIAPLNLMGLTGGIFNFASNLAGVVTPLVIGYVVSATGSFYYALAYTGVVALVGAISYIFVLGDVRRIEIE
jgi:ACS family D-galactonate transporter-like MFS transporter